MYIVLNSEDRFVKVLLTMLIIIFCINIYFLCDLLINVNRMIIKAETMQGIVRKNIELNLEAKDLNKTAIEALGGEIE